MGTQKSRLSETILLSIHNIGITSIIREKLCEKELNTLSGTLNISINEASMFPEILHDSDETNHEFYAAIVTVHIALNNYHKCV